MPDFSEMFKPIDATVLAEIEEKAKKEIEQTAALARHCFSLEDFQKYRKQYLKMQEKIVDRIIAITRASLDNNIDLQVYAARMIRIITRLEDLRFLLQTVETERKKGNEKAEE